jgi:hypothetical protein
VARARKTDHFTVVADSEELARGLIARLAPALVKRDLPTPERAVTGIEAA